MTRTVFSRICLALCACLALARATATATDQETEKELRQLEEALRAAFVKSDAPTVERLLADDYTTTNANGLIRTKAELIADLKAGAVKTESLTLENIKVRVYGDAAVLTADRRSKGSLHGKDTSGYQRMLRVLVKKDGRWQAVAYAATSVR